MSYVKFHFSWANLTLCISHLLFFKPHLNNASSSQSGSPVAPIASATEGTSCNVEQKSQGAGPVEMSRGAATERTGQVDEPKASSEGTRNV